MFVRMQRTQKHKISYPAELPIVERRKEIVTAIRSHRVLVIAGETGSGKTTQIPKMCLEAGRGTRGLIGCTQPRRIAALTVADRIAQEMGDESLVACKIRFHDTTKKNSIIRIMTDGILLSEAQHHPSLRAYDTIIIDEAHERSLNIDVLLGLMHQLLNRRKDLKLIITSATLDTEKFSRHFQHNGHPAPIIEVSGRTFPVEIRYRSTEEEQALSLPERSAHVVKDVLNESQRGDILVFLPTEQDIKETIHLLGSKISSRLNICPMYARLPFSEQRKAFELGGRRKIVVATNVAETSLTIPGIRYVVDTGYARISRYNPSTSTHGLPVDPISQASAAQRAGRCGRVENGICIRLYSEEDYKSRPQYTLPEIKRTNLAEIILRLLHIGIKNIEQFPFVDPPSPNGIKDGLRTLKEVGAIHNAKERKLSPHGKLMAQLPLDPRLARMLIHAEQESCLGDVLPIAAALSLQDPREKPPEQLGKAEKAHAAFRNENSDFIGWINIWESFHKTVDKGSYLGKLKRYCKNNFLSFRRMREWIDTHRQLALIIKEHGYTIRRRKSENWIDKNGEFTQRYASIHRTIISGLLSHICRRAEDGCYDATRNRKVYIHPGSALKKTSPEWIVASELVRTSRLFARSSAAVNPEWLEEIGAHLVTKNWINPHWQEKAATVMAEEQTRLFGFLINEGKMVPFGPVRPREARQIFIRCFLVEGEIAKAYSFLKSNRQLIARIEDMESKLRRKDILAGQETMINFYQKRLPPEVLDLATLNRALKENHSLENSLYMSEEDILTGVQLGNELQQFPDKAQISGKNWNLSYTFDPKSQRDGVTIQVPYGCLSELKKHEIDWMVPGLLLEKIEALMRGLPKQYRRKLIPISETAQAALKNMKQEGPLILALATWLYREQAVDIPLKEWEAVTLPDYLRMRFSLLNDKGREIASGFDPTNLRALSTDSKGRISQENGPSSRYRKKHEKSALKEWPQDLPPSVNIAKDAVLWTALKDDGDSVSLRFYDTRAQAEHMHREGQNRLAILHWNKEIRGFKKTLFLQGDAKVATQYLEGSQKMENTIWNCVMRKIFASEIVRGKTQWIELLASGGKQIYPLAEEYFRLISSILTSYLQVRKKLLALRDKCHRKNFVESCLAEAETIVSKDFINGNVPMWKAIPRWLRACGIRAHRGVDNPARDERFLSIWGPLNGRLIGMMENLSPMASDEKYSALNEAKIMMEELRVTLSTGGEIKALGKVSESRMKRFLDDIERMF